jgi:hypothetical protein
MPDGVRVVQADLLKESSEVVCRWPRLMLVAVCSSRDAPRARAACLPVAAVIMLGHGRDPLRMLLVPLLAAIGVIFGAVDGNVERHFLAAGWGHLLASLGWTKRDRLINCGI